MSNKDLEEIVEEITETVITAPVDIVTGVVKGAGNAIEKLFDW